MYGSLADWMAPYKEAPQRPHSRHKPGEVSESTHL